LKFIPFQTPIPLEIPVLDNTFLISDILPWGGYEINIFLKQLAGSSSLTANHYLFCYEHLILF